jgi:protein-histidine pros-kinase
MLSKQPEWLRPEAEDLLNSAPDGIVIVNARGEIVIVNSQTEILFGFNRQELIGQPVEIMIPTRFKNAHSKHRTSFLADPHVRPMGQGLELFGSRKDGKEFPVEISLSPLRTTAGLYVIAAIRDTTDRKHAEEKIKKLNYELGEALRRAELLGTTGELVKTMSHQIEIALATLARLLSSLERNPGANSEMKSVIAQAREELSGISRITSSALALQQEHDTWNRH